MRSLLIALAFAFIGLMTISAWSQDTVPEPEAPTTIRRTPVTVNGVTIYQDQVVGSTGLFNSQQPAGSKSRQAFNKVKNAESDDDRDAAIDELRDALEAEYEARLDEYENHLAALEEKVKKLTKQLDRRREAKSEMVNLKLKMMIHEADGLGWPEPSGINRYFTPASPFAAPGIPQAQPTRPTLPPGQNNQVR